MFNVYPVEISYTRTASKGVLAGIPCTCTVGVESEAAGRRLFNQMISANPTSRFENLEIRKKH